MKKFICLRPYWLTFTCLTLCLSFSSVSQAKNSNRYYVDKLWQHYAVTELLSRIKSSVYTGEENLLKNLKPQDSKKIKSIVDSNFEQITQHMKTYMVQHGKNTQLSHAHQWLSTPLGQKTTQSKAIPQSLFTDPEAPIAVKDPEFSTERVKLKKKFEKITYKPANQFATATLEHYLILKNHTKPPNQRLSDKELDQTIKSAKVKISPITTRVLPHVFAHNYNKMSLEEVTVILNYLDSSAGRGMTALLLNAYTDAINTTRPKTLLSLSKLFEDALSVLSPYSKVKLSDKRQRELMAMLIKRYGKPTIIRAMLEACNSEMTIIRNGDEQQVFGRPNQQFVNLNTLMKDLGRSRKDIRDFYKIVLKKLRY